MKFLLVARAAWLVALVAMCPVSAFAQSTIFTYQGSLSVTGSPANADFDLQLRLFDTSVVGTGIQQGSTLVRNPVTASDGVFTISLDFGTNVFSGADRFLEIGVRPAGNADPYILLSPRQMLTSTPYAIRTLRATSADGLSAACVGCVNSGHITSVSGSSVSGLIPAASVPSGSASYIQNGTSPQASSNFNISGDGVVGDDLNLTGDLIQARASNGAVKFMLAVGTSGTIFRCYNGVTGVTANPCGFVVTHTDTGIYDLHFGDVVQDRLATLSANSVNNTFGTLSYSGVNSFYLRVTMRDSLTQADEDGSFTILVF